jgi:hypothetical protein
MDSGGLCPADANMAAEYSGLATHIPSVMGGGGGGDGGGESGGDSGFSGSCEEFPLSDAAQRLRSRIQAHQASRHSTKRRAPPASRACSGKPSGATTLTGGASALQRSSLHKHTSRWMSCRHCKQANVSLISTHACLLNKIPTFTSEVQ